MCRGFPAFTMDIWCSWAPRLVSIYADSEHPSTVVVCWIWIQQLLWLHAEDENHIQEKFRSSSFRGTFGSAC